jgi:hypothetical protein
MTRPHDSLSAPFATAPHITDPSGSIAAWWTDPPGVLAQLTCPTRATTDLAEWLVGPAFDQVLGRFPDASELRVILDMRQMTGRSATARSLLMQRAKTVIGRVTHVVLVPSVLLGPAYIKVVETAALLLHAGGLRVDIDASLDRVVARYEVRAATPGPCEVSADLISERRPVVRGPARDLSRS